MNIDTTENIDTTDTHLIVLIVDDWRHRRHGYGGHYEYWPRGASIPEAPPFSAFGGTAAMGVPAFEVSQPNGWPSQCWDWNDSLGWCEREE